MQTEEELKRKTGKRVEKFIKDADSSNFDPETRIEDYRKAIDCYIAKANEGYTKSDLIKQEKKMVIVSDLMVTIEKNISIPMKIYKPKGSNCLPAIIYVLGSGFVHSNLNWQHRNCYDLSALSNCIVVSVSGRVAPENKFPTGLKDCYALIKWIIKNGKQIGIDTTKVSICGFSSGGNFAAVLARWARDEGILFQQQILISPWLDLSCSLPAYEKYSKGYLLDRPVLDWLKKQYLKDTDQVENPDISPIKNENLKGLPPALVIVAQCEPFHDEGRIYAKRLKEAGVETEYRCYPGQIHEFFGCNRWLLTNKSPDPLNEIVMSVQNAALYSSPEQVQINNISATEIGVAVGVLTTLGAGVAHFVKRKSRMRQQFTTKEQQSDENIPKSKL